MHRSPPFFSETKTALKGKFMFDQWKVLHLDEVEAENILFCRALAHEKFAGQCESVQSIRKAKNYLQRALFTPQLLSRPDIIVINWHPDCDAAILKFVQWIRKQPQLHVTPVIVFIKAQLSLAAQESAHREGVTELIVRPDTVEELQEQVHELLKRCANRCVVRQRVTEE
jgi:CheY-like chemotaxis protein